MHPEFPASTTPVIGLYETLVTRRLLQRMEELREAGWKAIDLVVPEQSAPHVLARHVGEIVRRILEGLSLDDQVLAANTIMESLSTIEGAKDWIDVIVEGPRQLMAIAQQEAPGVYALRPATPLAESSLITNASEDPSLGFELRKEIASADRVDLLCAFVKWYGIRVLEDALREAQERGVPIRVITTTYMGASDRHALDRLVRDFGAQVKVNYETRSTRLHAKAWLFRRNSGFDTAYIGSSNLSKSALVDGLEWNVRASSVATPAVLRKFEASFDSYWNDRAFEDYDPDRDAEKLDAALGVAGDVTSSGEQRLSLSGLEVRPYPHQEDMLERLRVERDVRGWNRNLLVAATGTGKTVMAALDYRHLWQQSGSKAYPRLLFIAHREEILLQSLRTYREVLNDASFGELLVGGRQPEKGTHLFASIQSLSSDKQLGKLSPDHFDIVVVDEFHHAIASTYQRVLGHFKPKQLLGLTATPERADGLDVVHEFFGGRIAAELRLWEALENDLLCPFHYFGIPDGTDLRQLDWRAGKYDATQLSNLYSADTARARIVIKQVLDKVSDPHSMRALGFCVNRKHAQFMTRCFQEAGFQAAYLDGESKRTVREHTLKELKAGRIQVIFSVDLFNEGLDVPDIDTLLLLRPTSSATIFLQQLGRGLRRTPNKPVLTVLDFIGQHRADFRFEEQFRAMTNLSRNRLLEHVERDFPRLPSGCQIILEGKSKDLILDNLRTQLRATVDTLVKEARQYDETSVAGYLGESRREIRELYKAKNSWTRVLRRARLTDLPEVAGEEDLLSRVHSFLHVDDVERAETYKRLLSDSAPSYESLTDREKTFARMLFFTIWDKAGDFKTYEEGLRSLHSQEAFRSELRQVLDYVVSRADHLPIPLDGPHAHVPLKVHSEYNRSEILAALGVARFGGRMPGAFSEGVVWADQCDTDAFLITREKDEKDFSPTVQYKDFALSPSQFHWETQNSISETSPTGQRYQHHVERGSHVLLFMRRYKTTDIGKAQPWMLLGPATYEEHTGNKPMAITWRLRHDLPADVWTYASAVA